MRIQRKLRRYNRAEGSPYRAAFCRAKNENMEVYYGRRKNRKTKSTGNYRQTGRRIKGAF